MIIDIHNHPDWYGHDFNKFLANMAQYNIDVTWLLSCETPTVNTIRTMTGYSYPKVMALHCRLNAVCHIWSVRRKNLYSDTLQTRAGLML